jgi:hypothetical protein
MRRSPLSYAPPPAAFQCDFEQRRNLATRDLVAAPVLIRPIVG